MGWSNDAYDARKSREEYGNLGDHCWIAENKAKEVLQEMGLNIDDVKPILIEGFIKTNGYPPSLLPYDPKWKARRDTARARLSLPRKLDV